MKLSALLSVTALLLSASASFAAEGTFDKTLTANGPVTLSVSSGAGYIHVYSGSENQIHIIGRVHVRNGLFGEDDADKTLNEIVGAPPIQQSGNTISIGKTGDSNLYRNVGIDYEITAPRSTTLTAHSGSGDLEIGGIQGAVTASSGSGSLHVDNIGGNSDLGTGSGNIRATGVHGAAATETGSGQIDLTVDAPGDVRARAGSGSIHLGGINGGVQATVGSGNIEIQGNPAFEWRAQSGSGSIHLQVPPAAHFNFDGRTGSGSVRVERPIVMQGSLNNHHVTGSVNGGGPTLRISSGSGSITVE